MRSCEVLGVFVDPTQTCLTLKYKSSLSIVAHVLFADAPPVCICALETKGCLKYPYRISH